MEYENMKVTELKALTRERGLRGYSQMRKADIIELVSNNQQSWAPDIPPHSVATLPGGAQVPWVWRTQVASDPRPACSTGPPAPP